MHKTIWGILCGPYGVVWLGEVPGFVLNVLLLLSLAVSVSVFCLCVVIMLCSRDSILVVLYFDKDTLIRTLVSVR